jgi:hypothetical protein
MIFVTVKIITKWKGRTLEGILGKPVQATYYASELSKKKTVFKNYVLFITSTSHKTMTL